MSCLREKLVREGESSAVVVSSRKNKGGKYKKRCEKRQYKQRRPIDLKMKYASTNRIKLNKRQTDNKTWGDEMIKSMKWPALTEDKTIRVLTHNVKGISQLHNYYEFEMLMDYMENMQVDIAGVTEMNLDLNKKETSNTLKKILKKLDRNAMASFSASKHRPKKDAVKKMGEERYRSNGILSVDKIE